MGELSIDPQIVVDRPKGMEVRIDEVPYWVGVGLDLVADDRRPEGGIEDDQIRT